MPSPPPESATSRRAVLSGLAATSLAGCSDLQVLGGAPRSTDETTCSTDVAPPAAANAGTWPMGGHDAGGTRHNPAVDARTAPGDPEWVTALPQSHLPTPPTVGANRLYVGIGNHEPTPAETRVAAFALDTGERAWERPLAFTGDATPTLADDGAGTRSLFVLSGQDNSTTGPGRGEVLALDPATGEKRWRWTVGRALSGPVVVADGRVFVHNTSYGKTAVHALDAASGRELWRFRCGEVLHHAPTVAGDRVFASRGRGSLVAVDAADGTKRWEAETKADDLRPVVDATRGHVLMGHPRGLEAFCAATGERAWHLVTTGERAPEKDYLGVIAEPVVTSDRLYVQTSDTSPFAIGDPGRLHGVDPASGAVDWTHSAARPASHVLGAGGVALVGRNNSEKSGTNPANPTRQPVTDVAALAPDGEVLWSMDSAWRPVATGSGRLVAYRGDTAGISRQVDVACFALS